MATLCKASEVTSDYGSPGDTSLSRSPQDSPKNDALPFGVRWQHKCLLLYSERGANLCEAQALLGKRTLSTSDSRPISRNIQSLEIPIRKRSADLLDCDGVKRYWDQSPIRNRSSHWRNSPLKPMLSAIWKLAMTHARFACRTFRRFRTFADFPPKLIKVGNKLFIPAETLLIGVGIPDCSEFGVACNRVSIAENINGEAWINAGQSDEPSSLRLSRRSCHRAYRGRRCDE
jgi:hypothetical protein